MHVLTWVLHVCLKAQCEELAPRHTHKIHMELARDTARLTAGVKEGQMQCK